MPRPVVDRKPKRLGYGTLGLITSGIGGEAKVKLVPSDAWGVEPDGTTITYPREALADTMESLALRSIYANVGHVLYSQAPSPWNAISKAVKRIERAKPLKPDGTPIEVGTFIPYGVMRTLERERVERVQRTMYFGLKDLCGAQPRPYLYHTNTKKPPDEFQKLQMEVDNIAAREPAGLYLPAAVLDGVNLDSYLDAPDFRTALVTAPALLAEITLRFLAYCAQVEPPEPQEPEAGDGDPEGTEPGDGDPKGSESGDGQPGPGARAGQGQSNGPKPIKVPQQVAEQLGNDSPNDQGFMDKPDVTAGQVSSVSAQHETLGEDFEDLVDERLASVLRQAFNEAIKPNRRWGVQGNLDRGKLQMRACTKAVLTRGRIIPGVHHVYGKRINADKRRFRIAFVTDNSGSMSAGVTSVVDANMTRIMLAARFVVSAITAVDHLPEVDVGVWVFDDEVHEVVPFGRHTTTEVRRKIGAQMVTTGGGGTDAPLAIATLRKANAQPTRPNTETLLILLTDGEWGDAKMVTKELQSLLAEGCDMAVFTIGCDANEAKSFVGDERADEINDDNAGEIIADHIGRLINPID